MRNASPHSHPSRSALASLPKGQPRHFLTFLFETPSEITSDSERRPSTMVQQTWRGKEGEEKREERREVGSSVPVNDLRFSSGSNFSVRASIESLVTALGVPTIFVPLLPGALFPPSSLPPSLSFSLSLPPPGPSPTACCTALLPRPFFISPRIVTSHTARNVFRRCVRYSSATS